MRNRCFFRKKEKKNIQESAVVAVVVVTGGVFVATDAVAMHHRIKLAKPRISKEIKDRMEERELLYVTFVRINMLH